jgi:hypothetical protein
VLPLVSATPFGELKVIDGPETDCPVSVRLALVTFDLPKIV